LELTRGFAVFPRGGEKIELTAIYQQDRQLIRGNPIYSEYSALTITDILSDNESRAMGFGLSNVLQTSFPAMFKTGTSNQFNNIWTLGATVDYTVGVWIGNFSGETVIGKTGSTLPALLAVAALKFLSEQQKPNEFKKPESTKRTALCALSGKKTSPHCTGVIYEYLPIHSNLAECDYHKLKNGRIEVVYPLEFQNWAASENLQGINFHNVNAVLKIIKPKEKATYFFDPSIRFKDQGILVEILSPHGEDELQVYHNGKFYKKLTAPFQFFFPMKKGHHHLKVISPSDSDEVRFTIK
ncbi:MAG: hypothetical protein MJB14_11960, partial [Spirochaetes bacterium]|nr:hypothetical protein [Spirochaetota bacterium]